MDDLILQAGDAERTAVPVGRSAIGVLGCLQQHCGPEVCVAESLRSHRWPSGAVCPGRWTERNQHPLTPPPCLRCFRVRKVKEPTSHGRPSASCRAGPEFLATLVSWVLPATLPHCQPFSVHLTDYCHSLDSLGLGWLLLEAGVYGPPPNHAGLG